MRRRGRSTARASWCRRQGDDARPVRAQTAGIDDQRQLPRRGFSRSTGWISAPFGATPSWPCTLSRNSGPITVTGIAGWRYRKLEVGRAWTSLRNASRAWRISPGAWDHGAQLAASGNSTMIVARFGLFRGLRGLRLPCRWRGWWADAERVDTRLAEALRRFARAAARARAVTMAFAGLMVEVAPAGVQAPTVRHRRRRHDAREQE